MITTITTILIALSLFLGGTGAAVYVSKDSVPGELLYSVKTGVEDLQYFLEHDPQDRLELALKFADQRASEAKTLLDNGEQLTDSFIKQWEKNLASVLTAAAEVEIPAEEQDQSQDGVMILKRPQDRAKDGEGPSYMERLRVTWGYFNKSVCDTRIILFSTPS